MEDSKEELREIEAKRSDICAKLARIEEKKTTVSFEVYTKVKKDYESKLKKIDAEMAQHVGLIKNELENLKQEETTIADEEKKIKLNLEEIELRYSIGEYDEESFKKLRAEHDKNLEEAKAKSQKITDRKKWLEDFITIKDIEETIEEAAEPTAESVEEPTTAPAAEPIEEKKSEEEIRIEEHILEEQLPEEIKLDEILVEEVAKPEVSEEQKTTPEQPEETEKEKNVPCPKCGHMNTPASWYCEKCGAELLDSLS